MSYDLDHVIALLKTDAELAAIAAAFVTLLACLVLFSVLSVIADVFNWMGRVIEARASHVRLPPRKAHMPHALTLDEVQAGVEPVVSLIHRDRSTGRFVSVGKAAPETAGA